MRRPPKRAARRAQTMSLRPDLTSGPVAGLGWLREAPNERLRGAQSEKAAQDRAMGEPQQPE